MRKRNYECYVNHKWGYNGRHATTYKIINDSYEVYFDGVRRGYNLSREDAYELIYKLYRKGLPAVSLWDRIRIAWYRLWNY